MFNFKPNIDVINIYCSLLPPVRAYEKYKVGDKEWLGFLKN